MRCHGDQSAWCSCHIQRLCWSFWSCKLSDCVSLEIFFFVSSKLDWTVKINASVGMTILFSHQEIARHLRPATLRAMFGKDKIKNAVHCTDLPEDGVIEVGANDFSFYTNREKQTLTSLSALWKSLLRKHCCPAGISRSYPPINFNASWMSWLSCPLVAMNYSCLQVNWDFFGLLCELFFIVEKSSPPSVYLIGTFAAEKPICPNCKPCC